MNHVDELLNNPFYKLTIEDKLEIKRLGPHQPSTFVLSKQCGNRKRSFCSRWSQQFDWLTVSIAKEQLFCFYCLLFGGDSDLTWSKTGFTDLQHFVARAKRHESTTGHLNSAVRYSTLGQCSILEQLDSGHAAGQGSGTIANSSIDFKLPWDLYSACTPDMHWPFDFTSFAERPIWRLSEQILRLQKDLQGS